MNIQNLYSEMILFMKAYTNNPLIAKIKLSSKAYDIRVTKLISFDTHII